MASAKLTLADFQRRYGINDATLRAWADPDIRLRARHIVMDLRLAIYHRNVERLASQFSPDLAIPASTPLPPSPQPRNFSLPRRIVYPSTSSSSRDMPRPATPTPRIYIPPPRSAIESNEDYNDEYYHAL